MMPRLVLDGFTPPLMVMGVMVVLYVARRLQVRGSRGRFHQFDVVVLLVALLVTGGLERLMGRPWTYRHGPVRVWSSDISSDQNSQQVSDPYTFTHVTHGALFYGMTKVLLPSASLPVRLLTAVGLEAAWEVYENTDTVINRYRSVTISLGYFGDSILNSVCDILACVFGFWLTSRLPRKWTFAWIFAVEVILAIWIRDNLTLNVLMLIYPFDAVRAWQSGI